MHLECIQEAIGISGSKILKFSLGKTYFGHHDPVDGFFFITDDEGYIEKFSFPFIMFKEKIPTWG